MGNIEEARVKILSFHDIVTMLTQILELTRGVAPDGEVVHLDFKNTLSCGRNKMWASFRKKLNFVTADD